MRIINIGAQGFDDIREHGDFYVDKTAFIREWWESRSEVTLITRPRRFGKTLNMSMLNCFFSNRYAGRGDLFEGLDIWKEEKYRAMQGTWPTIFLSFADVKETGFEQAKLSVIGAIKDLFQEFLNLWEKDSAQEKEKYSFMKISEKTPDADIARSLRRLCAYLEYRYGKKVLIFLDEYDTPLQEAFLGGYWREMSDFIRSLFNSTFKTNSSLERAVMTGITRVSKESIFSELNNPAVITTTSRLFATAFGFTEKEVFDALDEYGLSGQRENVKRWYDGFTFGDTPDIYNPWSIINYLKERRLAPYWANTSSNGLISYELQKSDIITKDQMQRLMNGEVIRTPLDEQTVYSRLDYSSEALWSLFLASGYLKVVQRDFDGRNDFYTLKLTNLEVELMFEKLIELWFDDVRVEYSDFMRSLIQGDVNGVRECMSAVLLYKTSFFDTGKTLTENRKPESFYHGLALGMVAQEKEYHIESNGESGLGRFDLMMIPGRPDMQKENRVREISGNSAFSKVWGEKETYVLPAILIEFKLYDKDKEKTLKETAKRALQQIEDRRYAARLTDMGYRRENIIQYGFGFSGKEVEVVMA